MGLLAPWFFWKNNIVLHSISHSTTLLFNIFGPHGTPSQKQSRSSLNRNATASREISTAWSRFVEAEWNE